MIIEEPSSSTHDDDDEAFSWARARAIASSIDLGGHLCERMFAVLAVLAGVLIVMCGCTSAHKYAHITTWYIGAHIAHSTHGSNIYLCR